MQEIQAMEQNMLEQEKFYQKQQLNISHEDDKLKNQSLKTLRQKELKYVTEQAENIAKIKHEKDKLERQRKEIMNQLDNIRGQGSRSGFRNNRAAYNAGSALMTEKPPSAYRNKNIEPSLQDKLINDQARINQLKQQQYQQRYDPINHIDEIDALHKDLEGKPRFYENVQKLQNDYTMHGSPNPAANLTAIRENLEGNPRGQPMYDKVNQPVSMPSHFLPPNVPESMLTNFTP